MACAFDLPGAPVPDGHRLSGVLGRPEEAEPVHLVGHRAEVAKGEPVKAPGPPHPEARANT